MTHALNESLKLDLRFNNDGLIPAIMQDAHDGTVLMFAWMNAEALSKTLSTRQAHFYSRSRQELWLKGATSGEVFTVRDVKVDCDQDCLLLTVTPEKSGNACHTGRRSCFYRTLAEGALQFD
jgi:phosphoribosyl-AMP cyclohydrolase